MCQGPESLLGVVHQQVQVGLSTPVDDAALVLIVLTLFTGRDGRAVSQQAHHQKCVSKRALLGRNANVNQRVQVEQAYFHVFNTVFLQRDGRALARFANTLGPDASIKLVFNLQHVGIELLPVVAVLHANGLVERVGRENGLVQRRGVFGQRIEAHIQIGLHAVLVTQIAHAQTGGIRPIQRARCQLQQVGLAALQERGVHRGRCAKQIGNQPAITQEIADQPKVSVTDEVLQTAAGRTAFVKLGPKRVWQGPVVVHPGNGLHVAAIAVAQTFAVHVFDFCAVGCAVIGQRDVLVVAQQAGHGAGPHEFVTEMARGIAVNVTQKTQGKSGILRWGCDELQKRLRIVCGDPGVGQFGTQRLRVLCLGQMPIGVNPQTFLFKATGNTPEHLRLRERRKLRCGIATGELQHDGYLSNRRHAVWQLFR